MPNKFQAITFFFPENETHLHLLSLYEKGNETSKHGINNRHATSDPSNMKLVSLDSALKQERNRIGIPRFVFKRICFKSSC